MNYAFAFALGIGFAAGLRSLTPPAVVAWTAHLGWLNLNNSPLAFMGSMITVFRRGSGGHVGFFIEKKNGLIYVLGGNQHDCVCIDGHDEDRLLGYRMNA